MSHASEGIRELSRTTVRKGRKFDFEVVRVRMPGGQELDREIVRHGGSAVILPILDIDGRRQIVFVENHRFSIGRTLLEIPAGTLEPGEDPAVCAARELIEETGYRAARVEPLAEFYPTPGMTDERMRLYLATGLTHVGQDLEDDESITVRLIDAAEALRMATDRTLDDGKSILAITLAHARGLL
ncbi:MAG: NUDIX domain-containing protein [Phycisphaerales bacterium]|nr:NUDIX domain-containing protein [Phycisphaerales bacterium]